MKQELLEQALVKVLENQKNIQNSLDDLIQATNMMIDILAKRGNKNGGYKYHK